MLFVTEFHKIRFRAGRVVAPDPAFAQNGSRIENHSRAVFNVPGRQRPDDFSIHPFQSTVVGARLDNGTQPDFIGYSIAKR